MNHVIMPAVVIANLIACRSPVIADDTFFTNGLVSRVQAVLPSRWYVAHTTFRPATHGSIFGPTDHYTIAVIDRDRRMLHFNWSADAGLVFIPAQYRYAPDLLGRLNAVELLATNSTHQVCLWYGRQYPNPTSWPSMRQDLKRAFSEKDVSNTLSQGMLGPARQP